MSAMSGRAGRFGVLIAVAAFLSACSGGEDAAREERIHKLMADVLDPAAGVIWSSAGYVITEQGETELWPTTDEGWVRIVENADIVMEAGRTLAGPDYAPDSDDWREISAGLVTAAERTRRMAETRDKQGLFDAGGHLYRVCLSCHTKFVVEPEMLAGEDAAL